MNETKREAPQVEADITSFKAIVVNVVDGDTIDILELKAGSGTNGNDNNNNNLTEKIRVRLLGVNTPDRKLRARGYEVCRIEYADLERVCFDVTEERYMEARSYLQDTILGREVTITYDQSNPFGTHDRLLALVNINGTKVNRSLLSNGCATVFFYAPNKLFDMLKKGDYLLAESEARNKGIGIWGEQEGIPVPPKVEATVLMYPAQTYGTMFIGVPRTHKFTVLNSGIIDARFTLYERFENMDREHIESFASIETHIAAGDKAELEVVATLSEEAISVGETIANYSIWTRLVAVEG